MSVDSVASRFNPLIAAVLRSPLHGLLSPGLMLITVTGHRSGRRYSFPVGYQRDGRVVTIMVSEARHKSWWRNYHEPGPVELRLRGRQLRGTAEVVEPGSDEFRKQSERTLRRMPWLGRVFGVEYDKREGLSAVAAERLGEQIAIVQVTLDERSA